MRHLVILALLAPLPAAAAELWCMPQEICDGGGCHPTTDEETSVRLADWSVPATSMRSSAQDVPMTRIRTGRVLEWQGVNRDGGTETLKVRRRDLSFTYVRRLVGRATSAKGWCEVQ